MQKLSESGCIICCDGATDQLINNGMEPYVIIGDLDSIDSTLKPKYADRIIHLPDQGENDLMKAIRWTEDNGIEEAAILGATGKRDDHSLANIFILLQFPTFLKCTFITNNGVFSTAESDTSLAQLMWFLLSAISEELLLRMPPYLPKLPK